jgi:Domain of unknown function (DUF4124)
MYTRLLACAAVLLTTSTLAEAQVFKCTNAAGQIIYSDAQCPAGTSGEHLERRRTAEEIRRERMLAEDAKSQKQRRQMAEAREEWSAQQRALADQSARPSTPHGGDWLQRKQRQNAATSSNSITRNGGNWDSAAEKQRNAARRSQEAHDEPTPQATVEQNRDIHSCLGSICDDWNGNRYTRNPMGSGYTASDGTACRLVGGEMRC